VFSINETRLSVRVDNTTKRNAEAVFNALGMNLSTGINIFLTRVAQSRSIPFTLELDADQLDARMRGVVKAKLNIAAESGAPIALYDDEQNRPYLDTRTAGRFTNLTDAPQILVFAGSNGFGKSSVTSAWQTIGLYINADDIKLKQGSTGLEAACQKNLSNY
jgi:DNA-damage-inducible protein J